MDNVITDIETCKRNKDRANIFIDGEFAFALDKQLIIKFHLKKGLVFDSETLSSVLEDEEYIKCKNAGLNFIEKSSKTEKQVFDKLVSKEFNEKAILRTIDFMKEYRFLDDVDYVNRYVNERSSREGIAKIKMDLLRKGIDEDLIMSVYAEIDSKLKDEYLRDIAIKRYESLKSSQDTLFMAKQKLQEFLMRKGFNFSSFKGIIEEICNEDDFAREENDIELISKVVARQKKTKDKNKTIRYFLSKGYSYEEIKNIFKSIETGDYND